MDRRTLLAFALLTLVLVLFQVLAPAPERAPDTPQRVDTAPQEGRNETGGQRAPSEIRQPGPAERPAVTPGLSGEFENILVSPEDDAVPLVIDTDRYYALLNPVGGVLTTWRLEAFTDAVDLPVDLVADPRTGLYQFRLVFPDRTIDFSRVPFQISTFETSAGRVANLRAEDPSGMSVRLDYTFPREGYMADVRVSVDGIEDPSDVFLELSFAGGISHPERDPKVDQNASAGVALLGRRYVKHGMGRGNGGWTDQEYGVLQWAGVRSKYFLIAAVPEGSPDGTVRMWRPEGERLVATALRLPLNLAGSTEYAFGIYAGPMQYGTLEAFGVGLEKSIDLGWRVLRPFSQLLLRFFQAVHTVLPNYGVVILVLSILTKVIFYPLTKKSMESMRQMQLLKPEMDRLNAKYKEDPQRRNQAMMEMYKKHKINPMGGCLPLLIQMPVFIALYNVLNTSIELRKAPFVLWIRDLSAPDRVGEVFGLPIHILPLVMAATMLWQQKLTPTDPRQAALAYLMPIVMLVFFYPMPSGLVLYWTVNNVMSVGQQILMNRSTTQQKLAA